jgi:hypothetical protein
MMEYLLGAHGRLRMKGLGLTLALATIPAVCHAQVANGDFSTPGVNGFAQLNSVPNWSTTDAQKKIEIWKGGTKDPATGRTVSAPPGIAQFAEVNATSHGTLSQVVNGIKGGSQYGFSFWHRGRHSETEDDKIEVSVKDGANVWKKTFFTNAKQWVQYTVTVGTKNGDGPVTLSFESKATASGNMAVGNFLTGIKLDASVKPPACVANVGGRYDWTVDNTKNSDGKVYKGVATLNAADQKASSTDRTGVWQVTNDCKVVIDWEPGQFHDVMTATADGKQLTGTNQINSIITGVRK